jgi:ribonuclease HIII
MSDSRFDVLKQTITRRGWRWRPGKPVPYGEQIVVCDGAAEAVVTFYPKRGRSVIGGPPGPLRIALEQLVGTPPAMSAAAPTAAPVVAEIGMDESGKGDWFGPLVVAAVYLPPTTAAALAQAGVRDSKSVASADMAALAQRIEAAVPPTERVVLALDPAEYNRRYAAVGNINLLLSALYVEAVRPLYAVVQSERIVCDQFAQSTERLATAFRRAGLPQPIQQHHAEAASVAVAAASVLAAARFAAELEDLGRRAGLPGPLPRGASAIGDLRRAGRAIIAREGPAGLGAYAKLNFKPVQELVQE